MKSIWFILIFLTASFFYTSIYTLTHDDIEEIRSIGFIGIHVFFLLLLYAICTIYFFHVKKILDIESSPCNLTKFCIVFFSIFVPIVVVGESQVVSINFNFKTTFSTVTLCLLLFDYKDKMAFFIVELYEKRVQGCCNDMFLKYPPEKLSDIYVQLFLWGIIIILLSYVT